MCSNNFLKKIPTALEANSVQNKLSKQEELAILKTFEDIMKQLANLRFPIHFNMQHNIPLSGYNLIQERLEEAGYCVEIQYIKFDNKMLVISLPKTTPPDKKIDKNQKTSSSPPPYDEEEK